MDSNNNGANAPGAAMPKLASEPAEPNAPLSSAAASSTATEAQRSRILDMLRHGEKTTFDFRRAGIMQSSTRIFELRALGNNIATVARRDLFDAEGYRHARVAVYALACESDGEA